MSATPETMDIGALADPRLRLNQAFTVDVRKEAGEHYVWSDDFCTWGSGPHLTAAIHDLQVTIADQYWDFKAYDAQNRLGPHPKRVYARMCELIQEVA